MPASLMRAAKIRATERGESLKDLVNRAVAHELGFPDPAGGKGGPRRAPLIGRDAEPAATVTTDDIESALGKEDIKRYTDR